MKSSASLANQPSMVLLVPIMKRCLHQDWRTRIAIAASRCHKVMISYLIMIHLVTKLISEKKMKMMKVMQQLKSLKFHRLQVNKEKVNKQQMEIRVEAAKEEEEAGRKTQE